MGAGKSTLGRKLAEVLGFDFIDTDIFIESRFRERIVDMFDPTPSCPANYLYL